MRQLFYCQLYNSPSISRKFHFPYNIPSLIRTGLAGSAVLSTTEHVALDESNCPIYDVKDILHDGVLHTTMPFYTRMKSWFSNIYQTTPTVPSVAVQTQKTSYVPRFNIMKYTDVIISLIGIGISIRLLFYLIEQINPTLKEKKQARKRAMQIFKEIGFTKPPNLTDYEVCIAVNLMNAKTLSTSWNSIGGMDSIIREIQQSVIEPLQACQTLMRCNTKFLRPPKGVLLFGPPGCGKTLLAKALAKSANANFINLQLSSLVNMWYGETQKYVEALFSLAHKLQPVVIFIDEIDSFLTTRSQMDNEATRMIKTQFMALWDGMLTEDNLRILIVGATNRPNDLDQAILRRLPYKIHVPLPNIQQRVHILQVLLQNDDLAKDLSMDDIKHIASETDNLSGSDLAELCREAAFICLHDMQDEPNIAQLAMKPAHFSKALLKLRSHSIGHHMQLN